MFGTIGQKDQQGLDLNFGKEKYNNYIQGSGI